MYKVIALMGEAGTGKDTLMQKILKENPGKFNEIISCTTRPMREGEVHGVNYYYLTPGEFIDRLSKNEMFEMAEFNGWYYGMSVDALKEDIINIGVLNPEGIRSLLAHPDVDVIAVFKIVCRKKTRLLRLAFLLLFILYVEKYGLFRINITDILAPDEIIFSNIKKC